ncbi:hypothetical protein Y1Q_0018941 [Alligator mississippiensis]|uniref:Uncharacterized protein n=1 Tax=Alligator mississippiensis TaxID=8496 RepID=A0A151M3A0_ALLMI|nr:hypothetical protein Y1Q_0018941 [Alligator mississippiensis]
MLTSLCYVGHLFGVHKATAGKTMLEALALLGTSCVHEFDQPSSRQSWTARALATGEVPARAGVCDRQRDPGYSPEKSLLFAAVKHPEEIQALHWTGTFCPHCASLTIISNRGYG